MNRTARKRLVRCTALILSVAMAAQDAAAWGPRARRAIAAAAISEVRGQIGDVFIVGDFNYESDLIRGAVDGLDALDEFASFHTEAEAIDSVMNEIDLLAEVRTRGIGSYFAYRTGALSALAAQIMIPYGFPRTPEEKILYARMTADLERYVEGFKFNPKKSASALIDNPEYFRTNRPFIDDDLTMIREEYGQGDGYAGFLDDAGSAYFQRSVEAAAAAWNSIMAEHPSALRRQPPATKLAEYFIDEIRYHLEVKNNTASADRAYREFAGVNPGITENFVTIGDLYYAHGTETSKERAVHEWKIAQKAPGPQAREAARRISDHYLKVGATMFERSQTPEALDTDLEDSRRAYQTALEFDGTSERAAGAISEVTVAINKRRELYDQQQTFIDNATTIRENAERSLLNQDYVDALDSFQQALDLADTVGPEFGDLQEQAKDLASDLRKSIKSAISELFDQANLRVQEADKAVAESKIEDAVNVYRTVEALLSGLPEEEGSIDTQRKLDMLALVATKLEDAEVRLKNQQASGKKKP